MTDEVSGRAPTVSVAEEGVTESSDAAVAMDSSREKETARDTTKEATTAVDAADGPAKDAEESNASAPATEAVRPQVDGKIRACRGRFAVADMLSIRKTGHPARKWARQCVEVGVLRTQRWVRLEEASPSE